MTRLKVLVVDDDATNRELAEALLESLGHEAAHSPDGADAVARCTEAAERYDLILMDIMMPRMEGFEAARRLRAHATTADTPILFISGNVRRLRQETPSYHQYLAKPYTRTQLKDAIERALDPAASV